MIERQYKYLSEINSPADLKKIPREELEVVSQELRQFIIDEVSKNPGHLGSSLGVVELTVALHYVFDTPYDRIIWDVGHQAYGHKILTGRRDVFHTNRQFKGISGFPSPKESEYDAFGVGHSSTSISAGLGMSVASLLQNDAKRKVVAVIGDGSMTGGLAFEGLNNTSMDKNNLLIVLNDNQMAIDPIKGGFSQYLVDITTSRTYNKIRYGLYTVLRKLGFISESRRKRILRFNNSLKAKISSKQPNIFEGLNIRYFGPVDGHDVDNLVRVLNEIKEYEGPKVLHIITKKGKGYKPAEEAATIWHAPGKFDVSTGVRDCSCKECTPPLFQDVFGETLLELAKQNDKIVGVTPAMPSGCSMCIMQEEFPDRVFDVGIAEGHAVTFSAGLAKEGLMPFCNIYSSFMQRAYDNIIHDVALQKLNVVFCIDRAGIVGSDGATHQGQFDLSYLRFIPNMTIAAPRNEMELRNLMYTAQLPDMGPFAIRYPRGNGFNVDWETPLAPLEVGKGEKLKDGKDIAVLTIGTIAHNASKAIEEIEREQNVTVAHYDLRFLKPLDETLLHEIGQSFTKIVTIEDGVIKGGFGSAVLEFMADNDYSPQIKRLGIPDNFIEHGTQKELFSMLGLDAVGIAKSILDFSDFTKAK
ncbi:1-deoxy-D-xylulose-5-phosphate synthase [Paludibacter sp. 221]|uniref:1-deoxy-D-xylulose-5-phosphate synthase n=1 Tax=Paludibacter sp. 221 TaxID=2302939 RepID=UPI0013D2717B|nr:1-deoxy-D-xylulose-5-phosphate synthase [Paludibacter sp. 221]NDV46172.1 1-deoxy-D-xylulose-5-phosphate synthase [Paludibacter sp. 221]